MQGIIFDIQYGATYDGPGLRTCVFFKGCPLRCKWCQNPESHLLSPQLSYLADRCISCGECIKDCSEGLLKMKNNGPMRNEEKCILCGACAEACSQKATEVIGMEIDTTELLLKARRDRPFYDFSGGGVTISGGEPTMQYEFLISILEALRGDNISTAIETCGYFDADIIDNLIEVTDLFLFDIKHMNSEWHKQYTGKANEIVKMNFEALIMKGGVEKVVPRIPLIPKFNIDTDSVYDMVDYFKRVGYCGEVHLMPYNHMAKTKWEKIGRGSEYLNFGELPEYEIEKITGIYEKAGFAVILNR